METIRNEHLSEAEIEEYACGRLPRETATAVLGHLLNCDQCATLLEEEQDFRQIFRAAAQEAAQTEPAKAKLPWSGWSWFTAPAMAAAAVVALVAFFVPAFHKPNVGTQTVSLSAYRGGDTVVASASAPLVLRLDATGLDLRGQPEVRIVDAAGREVWRGIPQTEKNLWIANINKKLDAGLYWVRVFRQGDLTSQQREFRLDVK